MLSYNTLEYLSFILLISLSEKFNPLNVILSGILLVSIPNLSANVFKSSFFIAINLSLKSLVCIP